MYQVTLDVSHQLKPTTNRLGDTASKVGVCHDGAAVERHPTVWRGKAVHGLRKGARTAELTRASAVCGHGSETQVSDRDLPNWEG